MLSERIYLRDGERVYMDALCIDGRRSHYKNRAIIVFPGGGYGSLAAHEAQPIARSYLARGYQVFVLYYSVSRGGKYPMSNEHGVPYPLLDASLAVAHVRKNAEKYNIDPDDIAVLGFSAGGHLAASIATMWHYDFVYEETGLSYGENKPNAAVLCYPVISADPAYGHVGSFKNLLSGHEDYDRDAAFYSAEKQVSDKTCPCYIWTTSRDTGVPILNSYAFAEALGKYNIPYQLHVFPEPEHGSAGGYAMIREADWLYYGSDVPAWALYNRVWPNESVDFFNYLRHKKEAAK